MNRAILRSWFDAHARWEKSTLIIGTAILLFVSVRTFIAPESKTVYPIFSAAGRLWWNGIDLYDSSHRTQAQDGYRYSPTFAVLITPFALLPDSLGGVAWRLFNALALLWSLDWLARTVLPIRPTTKQYAWLLLLTMPLCLQSVNNGQVNLLVAACMLRAIAAVKEERWNLASALLAAAFVIKLYPLALGLVLFVLYPRQLSWRLPLALAASLLLPFFSQQPGYVLEQYAHWITLLRSEDRSAIPLEHMYRDLWLLIHLYGLPISRSVYVVMQIGTGIGIAVLCWHRQRSGWPARSLLTATLALVSAWMMLLGPATESSSFVLLAPVLAWSVIESLQTPVGPTRRFLLWVSGALFAGAVLLGGFASTVFIHGHGIHVWASMIYAAYLVTEPRPTSAAAVEQPRSQRLAA